MDGRSHEGAHQLSRRHLLEQHPDALPEGVAVLKLVVARPYSGGLALAIALKAEGGGFLEALVRGVRRQ
jgi:hypothetical protein